MSKYIDADRLKAGIERRKKQSERRLDNIVPIRRKDTMDEEQLAKIELRDKVDKAYLNGVLITLSDILSCITSLQQEQPDKYETALEKAREWMPNVNQGGHAILIDIFSELGEGLDPRYGGRKQEQPEVDLENAARNVYESWMGGTMDDVRRDMVELGKVLNARKEE